MCGSNRKSWMEPNHWASSQILDPSTTSPFYVHFLRYLFRQLAFWLLVNEFQFGGRDDSIWVRSLSIDTIWCAGSCWGGSGWCAISWVSVAVHSWLGLSEAVSSGVGSVVWDCGIIWLGVGIVRLSNGDSDGVGTGSECTNIEVWDANMKISEVRGGLSSLMMISLQGAPWYLMLEILKIKLDIRKVSRGRCREDTFS